MLDSGARAEDWVINRLVRRRIDVWRRPGIKTPRTSDEMYLPDAGAYLPELADLVLEQTPDVHDERPAYNVLVEVKSQHTTGSAKNKIPGAIVDLAHASDRLGVPAVMLLDLPQASDQLIRAFKADGRLHSVVVLTAAEVTRPLLVAETRRVALERRRLARRIGPRGGYTPTKRPPAFERGLAMRVAHRHLTGRPAAMAGYGTGR